MLEKILFPHKKATIKRIRQEEVALILQDTSVLSSIKGDISNHNKDGIEKLELISSNSTPSMSSSSLSSSGVSSSSSSSSFSFSSSSSSPFSSGSVSKDPSSTAPHSSFLPPGNNLEVLKKAREFLEGKDYKNPTTKSIVSY